MTVSSALLAVLLLLVGLGAGTVVGYTLAVARRATMQAGGRDEAATARADAAQWQARAEELSERAALAEERAERDGAVLRALAPVRMQLEQVSSRVETMEKQRAAQHATLSEQLRATAATEQALRQETSALAGALRSRSTRGLWGEVELVRVLEASGMMPHVDFLTQRSIGSVLASRDSAGGSGRAGGSPAHPGPGKGSAANARPDVVIHLPGDGFLALDAKAPMDAYLRAAGVPEASVGEGPDRAGSGAGTGPAGSGPGSGRETAEQERRRHLAAHAKALRGHVDALADRRYDRLLGTSPELVVLFIPAEPVLAAALESDPALLEHALNRGVALTSPSSLLALLRTCALAWARTAVTQDAEELLELGRTLYERLSTVAGHLDSLGSSISRSVTAYNRTVASLESRLLVTARAFGTLGAELSRPSPIAPDSAQLRSLSAPELMAPPEPT